MVNDYLTEKSRNDPVARRALADMRRHGAVIPASLDFGIVLLRPNAEHSGAGALRQAELEKAEKTFLAIQGSASKSSEFRRASAKSYYWMGKTRPRRPNFSMKSARPMTSARPSISCSTSCANSANAANASPSSTTPTRRPPTIKSGYQIAAVRVLFTESQDRKNREWLDKCDPADSDIRSQLCQTRGAKALWEGRDADAVAEFRRGIEFLTGLPESHVSLNNSALLY